MSKLHRRVFRVTFDIEVTLADINDELAEAAQKRMHPHEEDAVHVDVESESSFLMRDQAVLQALLQHPTTLLALMKRFAADSTEFIDPDDDSIEVLRAAITDGDLVEQLRENLSDTDYTFLKTASEDGILFDNIAYLVEALQVRQLRFTLEDKGEA